MPYYTVFSAGLPVFLSVCVCGLPLDIPCSLRYTKQEFYNSTAMTEKSKSASAQQGERAIDWKRALSRVN